MGYAILAGIVLSALCILTEVASYMAWHLASQLGMSYALVYENAVYKVITLHIPYVAIGYVLASIAAVLLVIYFVTRIGRLYETIVFFGLSMIQIMLYYWLLYGLVG